MSENEQQDQTAPRRRVSMEPMEARIYAVVFFASGLVFGNYLVDHVQPRWLGVAAATTVLIAAIAFGMALCRRFSERPSPSASE